MNTAWQSFLILAILLFFSTFFIWRIALADRSFSVVGSALVHGFHLHRAAKSCLLTRSTPYARSSSSSSASPEKAFRQRLQEIRSACPDPYPRLVSSNRHVLSCADFQSRFKHLQNDQTAEEDTVQIYGRCPQPVLRDWPSLPASRHLCLDQQVGFEPLGLRGAN